MTRFKIAETTVDSPGTPCLLVFGGARDPVLREKLRRAVRDQRPDAHLILLWDSPDGHALQFDGPFELTPWFSRHTPEQLRGMITGELEV